jgi:predicted RNA-binding Zn ribbon-like protein
MSAATHSQGWTFDRTGGRLAIDFANTVSRRTGTPVERIPEYQDLVAFGVQTGVLSEAHGRRLLARARERPLVARRVAERARQLREALHRIFCARAAGTRAEEDDLALVNEALGQAFSRLELVAQAHRYAAEFRGGDELDAMIPPLLRDAMDLLTAPDEGRLRRCEFDECRWLFFDGSKNKSRRWCDMRTCGNVIKARRHYAKQRDGG